YYPVIILDVGNGCLRPITSPDSIVVGEINADFLSNVQHVCREGAVQFADMSFGFPDITLWHWDFGDGNFSTAQNPVNYYSQSGVYTVKLVATSSLCSDTVIKTGNIVIDPGPLADFTASQFSGCDSIFVNFQDQTISDSAIVSYQWNFGNMNTASVQNPGQSLTVGQYDIELIVMSSAGCLDTVSKPLTVHALPVVTVSPDTAMCLGEEMLLQASGADSYLWQPTNGLNNNNTSSVMAS